MLLKVTDADINTEYGVYDVKTKKELEQKLNEDLERDYNKRFKNRMFFGRIMGDYTYEKLGYCFNESHEQIRGLDFSQSNIIFINFGAYLPIKVEKLA